ncbi:MAG: response regulator transcription factor [Elusimicrobia bacterium]|nr:response regulator transcription factor [Elusimicrobiota bacterium]
MARLLIIEDDGALMELMSVTFFKEGYEAHYAFNGKEGYEKALALHPDVIILDLMLPVMSGIDVLKKVSVHPIARSIPVIVVTGYGDRPEALEETIRSHGAVDYLRKPFELGVLVRTVARVLGRAPVKTEKTGRLSKGAVGLDVRYRTVWIDDKLVATLSPQKAAVLKLLLAAPGPVKKESLLAEVWGNTGQVSALEKTIQRLREDLGPAEGRRIQTAADGYELIG